MKKKLIAIFILSLLPCFLAARSGYGGLGPGVPQTTKMRIPAEGYMFFGFTTFEPSSMDAPGSGSGTLIMDEGMTTASIRLWTAVRTNWDGWKIYISSSPLKCDEDGRTTYIPYDITIDGRDASTHHVHKEAMPDKLIFEDSVYRHDGDSEKDWKRSITITARIGDKDTDGELTFLPYLSRMHTGTITVTVSKEG